MKITINTPVTIDGISYTAGQVVEFPTQALYDLFLGKFDEAITPDDDKGTRPLIARLKENQILCEGIYWKVIARQIKGGLLNQTLVKQRNIDTAMAPFMVPLYMGRVVAAIAGIQAVTGATITNHSPFITAAGLLKLRNELHDILGIAHVANYNDVV